MLQQLGGLNNEMTGTMDMERAESSFSSLLRRGFFAISPNIFTDELHKYVLHKWGGLEIGWTDRVKVFSQVLSLSIDVRANIVKLFTVS